MYVLHVRVECCMVHESWINTATNNVKLGVGTCFLSVLPEVGFSLESFATPQTCDRPLPRVHHHVFFPLAVQCKGFAANLTHERPRQHVSGSAVSHQIGPPLVRHATVVTLERPVLCMLNHVNPQLGCARPAFPQVSQRYGSCPVCLY